MAVNPDYAGRKYPAGDPYEVSRVKIAEFADAIGDPNPVYRDPAAARAAGHPDVIAPPTLAIVISMASSGRVLADPGLGLNYAMVVHGDQRFEHARPLTAGDVITAQTTISSIKATGRLTMLSTETQLRAASGELVSTAYSMLVERAADPAGAAP
jgi:acyl dehydratase